MFLLKLGPLFSLLLFGLAVIVVPVLVEEEKEEDEEGITIFNSVAKHKMRVAK